MENFIIFVLDKIYVKLRVLKNLQHFLSLASHDKSSMRCSVEFSLFVKPGLLQSLSEQIRLIFYAIFI